ncbi:AraC family ligand binding domain-containing protein [uncultured Methanolobus sp.]|uniref:AraC family ligand binding domain-containing protein n=1 Tax=uncultured Methanolobus sp. TaxID=218300 RepID=UPI002AAB58F4|nr:AraC family ligand binding domain-containing protein [uncultured Methanolobus sp.]
MKELQTLDSIEGMPGIDTLEGVIGPLMSGNKGSAHFIKMHADMYCDAHSHPTESIIYTSKGQWVLFAEGKRRHMKEGSLFFMPPGIETGYEVPFDKPASILIIKFEGEKDPQEFMDYLEGLKERLEAKNKNGEPFKMSELPADHPALIFANEIKSQEC